MLRLFIFFSIFFLFCYIYVFLAEEKKASNAPFDSLFIFYLVCYKTSRYVNGIIILYLKSTYIDNFYYARGMMHIHNLARVRIESMTVPTTLQCGLFTEPF